MNPQTWIEIIAVVATALVVYFKQNKLPPIK